MRISVDKKISRVYMDNYAVYYISDNEIQKLVGMKTYRLLYFNDPSLYTHFKECTQLEYLKDISNGLNSDITNFESIFVDTNYTSKDLKEDLIRILYGKFPFNSVANKLVNSSTATDTTNMDMHDWGIFILVAVIFSMLIILVLFLVIMSKDSSTTSL